MCTGKGELLQLARQTPASIACAPGRADYRHNREHVQGDAIAGDCVFETKARFGGETTRTEEVACEPRDVGTAARDFDVGELPEMGVDYSSRTLTDEKSSAAFGNKRNESSFR